MYVPAHFSVTDPALLAEVMQSFPFATVVTVDGQVPYASHVPLLLDVARGPLGTLRGHVARANPQWHQFREDLEVLCLFHGPHAYVSPRWYATQPAVPTWNYVTVHAYGRPRLIQDAAELDQLLRDTTRQLEGDGPGAWRGEVPTEFWSRLSAAIVGFEIPLTRIEGKFKLSQNRPAADIAGTIRALEDSAQAGDRELAAWMRRFAGA